MNAMFRVTYLLYVNTTTTHVTTPFAKKRFEKGFLAEIYSLCASERLLIPSVPEKLSLEAGHFFVDRVVYRKS